MTRGIGGGDKLNPTKRGENEKTSLKDPFNQINGRISWIQILVSVCVCVCGQCRVKVEWKVKPQTKTLNSTIV